MTLVYEDSFDKIRIPIEKSNIKIKHILLESNYDTVYNRILERGEDKNCWCIQNINLCLENQAKFTNVIRISSIGETVENLANKILKMNHS